MLLARVRCGGCGQPFDANVRTVPQWRDQPCCRTCWDKVNALRLRAGLEPWEAPVDAWPPPDREGGG